MLNSNISPSTSKAESSKFKDESSSISLSPTAARTGASLTAFTVTVIDWESVNSPSVTEIVNSSLPL